MKKIVLVLALVIFASSPAFAGGYYRSAPNNAPVVSANDSYAFDEGSNSGVDSFADGIAFILKLPFRLVTSTTTGVYGIGAYGNLEGFTDGYNVIK